MNHTHRVWHIALEPIDGRYSKQWLECIKPEFLKYAGDSWMMMEILGDPIEDKVTSGGFLDFVGTNVWKSSQAIKIANLFNKGYVLPNDVFLFTDAWNPVILQVRYMSDLMDIPVRIVSYWHAGSYDKWDTLGYKIKNREWSLNAERSFFHASDVNLFATQYHQRFFLDHCLGWGTEAWKKARVSGQPHYKIVEWFEKRIYAGGIPPKKEEIVLFPHRLCQEKRPEIFDELARRLPQYQFIRTQDQNLTKNQYYELLQISKVVFSAAEHEMLGISQMEGVLAGAIPIMPDRLSYKEIYSDTCRDFLYPTQWTNPDNVQYEKLASTIEMAMTGFNGAFWQIAIKRQKEILIDKYLTCTPMWDAIIGEV